MAEVDKKSDWVPNKDIVLTQEGKGKERDRYVSDPRATTSPYQIVLIGIRSSIPIRNLGESRSSDVQDKFIIVLGPAGSGKTSFIDLCCGSNRSQSGGKSENFPTSPDVNSRLATQAVEEAVFDYDGQRVHLLDTPGLDKSGLRSSLVLYQVAFYLAAAKRHRIAINEILYIEEIEQDDYDGYKNTLSMLSSLVGDANRSRIALVTSKWDSTTLSDRHYYQFELINLFWEPTMGEGRQNFILDGSRSAALQVITWAISQPEPSIPLLIQHELIIVRDAVQKTGFGRQMVSLWEIALKFGWLKREIPKKPQEKQISLNDQLNEFCDRFFFLDPFFADTQSGNFKETSLPRRNLEGTDTRAEQQTSTMRQHFSAMLAITCGEVTQGK